MPEILSLTTEIKKREGVEVIATDCDKCTNSFIIRLAEDEPRPAYRSCPFCKEEYYWEE